MAREVQTEKMVSALAESVKPRLSGSQGSLDAFQVSFLFLCSCWVDWLGRRSVDRLIGWLGDWSWSIHSSMCLLEYIRCSTQSSLNDFYVSFGVLTWLDV